MSDPNEAVQAVRPMSETESDIAPLIIEGDRVLLDVKNLVLSVEKDGVVIWSDKARPGDFVQALSVETDAGFVRVSESVKRTRP